MERGGNWFHGQFEKWWEFDLHRCRWWPGISHGPPVAAVCDRANDSHFAAWPCDGIYLWGTKMSEIGTLYFNLMKLTYLKIEKAYNIQIPVTEAKEHSPYNRMVGGLISLVYSCVLGQDPCYLSLNVVWEWIGNQDIYYKYSREALVPSRLAKGLLFMCSSARQGVLTKSVSSLVVYQSKFVFIFYSFYALKPPINKEY